MLFFIRSAFIVIQSKSGNYSLVDCTSIAPPLYIFLSVVAFPPFTPPYKLLVTLILSFLHPISTSYQIIYDWILGIPVNAWFICNNVLELACMLGMIGGMLALPLALPGDDIDPFEIGKTISPEEYTTLLGMVTFSWIYPLIRLGLDITLTEDHIWPLSPSMQSRHLLAKFSSVRSKGLFRRIVKANARDLALSFVLTITSAVLSFASPYFLKQVLDALALTSSSSSSSTVDSDSSSRQRMLEATASALLLFLFRILESQANLYQLCHGGRACIKITSQLMCAVHEKALKRKDLVEVVTSSSSNTHDEERGENASKVGGADIGKIVQLMSSDVVACGYYAADVYDLYTAPVQIIFGLMFLYQLLGPSTFASVPLLMLLYPMSSLLTNRSAGLVEDLLEAKDHRMNLVNEVVGAIKGIKWWGWGDPGRWTDKIEGMREQEIKFMTKERYTKMVLDFIWTAAPIGMSVISFASFVLVERKELTVPVAFTSVALFSTIRSAFIDLPYQFSTIPQIKVSVERLAQFLEEEEATVDLGIMNGWFKWNEFNQSRADAHEVVGPGTLERLMGWLRAFPRAWRLISLSSKTGPQPTPSTAPKASMTIVTDVESETLSEPDSSLSVLPSFVFNSATNRNERERRFELRDVNIVFPEGKITVVTGPTASGKSALLMALLGEMTTIPSSNGLESRILLNKQPSKTLSSPLTQSLSYAAQQPYLQHISIRQNILFGSPFNQSRYDAVLKSCALLHDLRHLPEGDATIVGDRGVQLSGGQKGRLGLARAVYSSSKWVLLDDPLSAVDASVARALYVDVLQGALLKDRTVVLVTHHVDLVLPTSEYFVRMKEGRIENQGYVKELEGKNALGGNVFSIPADKGDRIEEELGAMSGMSGGQRDLGIASDATLDAAVIMQESETNRTRFKAKAADREVVQQTGSVEWRVYKAYVSAALYWTWVGLILCLCLAKICEILTQFWIEAWSDAYRLHDSSGERPAFQSLNSNNERRHENSYKETGVPSNIRVGISLPSAASYPLFYVGIYGALGLLGELMSLISKVIQIRGGIRASRALFTQLLSSVMNATVQFHDTTPAGRILSRFSTDMTSIDKSIIPALHKLLANVATVVSAVVTISVVFPPFLVPAFFIGCIFVKIATSYLNTARDLRRMESTNKSPLFQGFLELLDGIVTVRAFSAEQRFSEEMFEKVDAWGKLYYARWMANRWLLVNYDILGAVTILVTTLMAIAGGVPVGLAGITITCAMTFTHSVYWASRAYMNLEFNMNAVERVVEYLHIPQDPLPDIQSIRPPAYWPSKTTKNPMLEVRDLEIRYAPELPSVINGVSFALRAGERIGLLGRTGSGKSTLVKSLLRFVDPHRGSIKIDGIDITSIGLSDLRSKLTFIPQDAVLFAGNVRENLDPFGELIIDDSDFTDAEYLDVLSRVHMIPSMSDSGSRATPLVPDDKLRAMLSPSQPSESLASITLDTKISARGANLSQGQRQLVALAKALLRQSSIVILDEACHIMLSIDFETDQKIQVTIREEFRGALVITIAHRLWTIIDYDRLIILDQGRMAEFDTPYNLIRKEGGIFRNMCLKSGMYQRLEEAARKGSEA
ncbi:P-loop containing nucleoside triphosphate hydrolase protein [Sistotremastrum suecicum HHB10207 ss-3]|uniref:p-loop containing nucleoside triphosphate hydrolase protein n=1 Tax=Sistotremastrum suecicum HHB10207 ss-3 TaxID=1314776 RepID=A0A166DIM3_9AGAM|nr:P-loop containing nucleoside triphosphate hydrolase protein [Sistotremastrum suecicum HHB10207 ss-3]